MKHEITQHVAFMIYEQEDRCACRALFPRLPCRRRRLEAEVFYSEGGCREQEHKHDVFLEPEAGQEDGGRSGAASKFLL